jgi:hypothetical protein
MFAQGDGGPRGVCADQLYGRSIGGGGGYDPGESGAMWVVTLVHWCSFVVCAGRSAR